MINVITIYNATMTSVIISANFMILGRKRQNFR